MDRPTVLVVGDDPLTRKVVRATLNSDGYAVLEAENGREALDVLADRSPDLILQDLVLPDLDGLELIKQIRSLPKSANIPVIAFTAFHSKLELARHLQVGFTDYILKPIEPSLLLRIVQAHTISGGVAQAPPGDGRRVLVVDDNPLQRKLLKIHLEQLGFIVVAAEDGQDGLYHAQLSPPDAIISDVLMPRLDGFRFCLALRQDPQLAHTPVLLTSAAFVEEADRQLAEHVGASAFVLRTPDLREIIETLLSSLSKVNSPLERPSAGMLATEYADRIAKQLSEQATISANLSQRLEWLEAKLAILAGLAETAKRNIPAEVMVDDVLRRALESTGAEKGAAYLTGAHGEIELRADMGYEKAFSGELRSFFGCVQILKTAMEQRQPMVVSSAQVSGPDVDKVLRRTGAPAILIIPLVYLDESLGALAVEWTEGNTLRDQNFMIASVTNQVSQAIMLTRVLADLRESKEILARTVETIPSGIIVVGVDGHITLANSAAERIFGMPRAEITSLEHDDILRSTVRGPFIKDELPFSRVMRDGEAVYGVEIAIEQPSGRRVIISVNAAPIRDQSGDIEGVVQSLSDITDQKRAEIEREQLLEQMQVVNQQLVITSLRVQEQEEELSRRADEMAALIENMSEGVSVANAEGRLVRINRAGRELWAQAGISREIGTPVRDLEFNLLHLDSRPLSRDELPIIRASRGEVFFDEELLFPLPDGRRLNLLFTGTAVRGQNGEVRLAFVVYRDITPIREAERKREEFISVVAHDLRGALTTVKGYADLLSAPAMSQSVHEKARRPLEAIVSGARRLDRMITDLLDVSRIEALQLALDKRLVDLPSLVRDIVQRSEELTKGHPVRVEVQRDIPAVKVDSDRIEQVLANLLSNAGKYAYNESEIIVEIGLSDGEGMVSVTNLGSGILPEDTEKIFKRFQRARQAVEGKVPGLGLGLYIAKGLVEAHGGRMWVESKPAEYATFRFILPLS